MNCKNLLISFLILVLSVEVYPEEFELLSPNQMAKFKINIGETITYSVFYKSKPIIIDAGFSLEFAQSVPYRKDFMVKDKMIRTIDETWEPVFGKHASIRNHCNELKLILQEIKFPGRILELIYRAYDDAVAFRYRFPEAGVKTQLKLKHEFTQFTFQENHTIWMADYNTFTSSQEKEFRKRKLSDLQEESIVGLPLLVKVSDNAYAVITEANLTNWAALYLTGDRKNSNDNNVIVSTLSPLPGSSGEDANKPLLAYINVPATSPWRVIMLSENPAKLLESEILMNLNDPCKLEDTSWILPGKCAWDGWWTGKGMSTELLKEYIDFAAHMGFPYQLVDAGWYRMDRDVTKINPNVDLTGLLEYAKQKNVKLWLWVHWKDLDEKYEEAFALYEKWGVAGVKIDYMNRDDQEMVNWYHKIVKKAAEHHLMVNFHGAYKPTGFRRTYPNLVTREGILGNEYNKWSDRVTPEHTVTIAFTRNLLGEMEFTPGGFLNRGYGKFQATSPTQVMGTRAHQLAMFVVYESPVTFLCDYPENYYDQPGLEFLKIVPTVWDNIRAINGEVGEYITIAKKSGKDWFMGVMTNSQARELNIRLDFLDEGNYEAHLFQDAADSDTNAENIEIQKMQMKKNKQITVKMVSGGGFVGYFKKID